MGIVFLWNEVLDHEKAFNEYLHHVGAGDAPRAIEAARKLLAGVGATLEKIQTDYPRLLIDAQMPEYWDVRKKFEGPPPSLREMGALASQLERYVSIMEEEVHSYRRKEPPAWLVAVSSHGKRIALVAGLVVAFSAVTWSVMKILHRGQGLTGEYYNDMELGVFYRARIDRMVDFSWGKGSPFVGLHKDHFSVRWTGFIRIPETGHYEFYVHVDDGARLTIDDKLLIDDWKVHKLHVVQASGDFEAGYHPIRLDYFERSKLASIRLYWKTMTSPRPEVVPARFLVPSDQYLSKGVPVFTKGPAVGEDASDGGNANDADEADEPAAPAPAKS